MKTGIVWSGKLENETVIRAIMLGDVELPPFTGRKDSLAFYLYQTALATIEIYRGEFEAASQLLDERGAGKTRLLCTQLARIWLEAETGDANEAWKKLNDWIEHRRPAGIHPGDLLNTRHHLTASLPGDGRRPLDTTSRRCSASGHLKSRRKMSMIARMP